MANRTVRAQDLRNIEFELVGLGGGKFALGIARADEPLNPIGAHGTDTTISSATMLTAPAGATKLLLQAFTQNVRYTLDGTTPTASTGFQLIADDPPLLIPVGSGMTVKVIEETASASIQYQWLS